MPDPDPQLRLVTISWDEDNGLEVDLGRLFSL
jgi:hypothetical protein